MNKIQVLVFAVSAVFSASAFAQEAAPTLNVEQGTVMTSTGGEFVSAASGKMLAAGERVMVGEGASASVVYANGCSYEYTSPGVYAVAAACTGGGAGQEGTAAAAGATDWAAVGIIAGTVAVGAVALDQMDDDDDNEPTPPVSR